MRQKFTMQITFPNEVPVFNGAALTLEFIALVGERYVRCSVTAEALEDYCGAPSILEDDLLKAFAAKKARIHRVCKTALKDNAGDAVILRSGYFRAYAMTSYKI